MSQDAGVAFECGSRRSVEDAVGVMRSMSKRGKLAGFEHKGGGDVAVAAHGTPFDSELRLLVKDDGVGSTVRGGVVLKPMMPALFALILIVTVYPGLPLTDSFLRIFPWYENLMGSSVETWMWYVPLTVIPAPFAWRGAIKKSKMSAHAHATETFARICAALGD